MDNKIDWKTLLRNVAFYALTYLAGAGTYHATVGPASADQAACACKCACKDCGCKAK